MRSINGSNHAFRSPGGLREVGSKFTIRNPRSYACARWINGRACSNRLQVRRDLVERLLLAQVKGDLSGPAIVEHVSKELRRRRKAGRPEANSGRLHELEREVDNLANAVASGALRHSPAVAARLAAAETELAKLQEPPPDTERDPVRARQALFQAIEEPITLHPENGMLVAEISYRAPLPLWATWRKIW